MANVSDSQPIPYGGRRPDMTAALRALERLFNDPGLASLRARAPSHPAVVQHAIASTFAEPDSESASHVANYSLEAFAAAAELLALMTDLNVWDAGEEFWTMVADPEMEQFLRTRLPKPLMYRDVLVELFYWSSLRRKGLEANLKEQPGLPDLHVEVDETIVWVEAKHIRLGTTVNRIRKVIAKASKQINAGAPTVAGIVYIHLTRDGQRAQFGENTASDVEPYLEAARRALTRESFRSVGRVVLSWDQPWISQRPADDEQPKQVMALKRQSTVVAHDNPRLPLLISDDEASVANTAMVAFSSNTATHDLAPYVVEDIEVSDLLRTTIERSQGLTPLHLIELVRDPSSTQRYTIDKEVDVVLATRLVHSPEFQPHVVVVEGTQKRGERLVLLAAFRMFGNDVQLHEWASDPMQCFSAVLRRFGLPVRVPGYQSELLFESLSVSMHDGNDFVFGVDREVDERDKIILIGAIKPSPDSVKACWLHAVDLKAYELALTSHILKPKH